VQQMNTAAPILPNHSRKAEKAVSLVKIRNPFWAG
jgi:hypothetical protein